jgi:hypothetical protein
MGLGGGPPDRMIQHECNEVLTEGMPPADALASHRDGAMRWSSRAKGRRGRPYVSLESHAFPSFFLFGGGKERLLLPDPV